METTSTTKKRILMLGGGFGGAYAALYLEKRLAADPNIEIALIAKENFVLHADASRGSRERRGRH